MKNSNDKRLLGDILQIKQAIAVDGIIDELRLIPSHEMLADVLTKGGQNGELLLESVRSGCLSVPGGNQINKSKKIAASTWQKLIKAKSEGFEKDTEKLD